MLGQPFTALILLPGVMMPAVRLVVVVMILPVCVPFAAAAMIRPRIALQSKCKSDQNDTCEYALACHVNRPCLGLRTIACGPIYRL